MISVLTRPIEDIGIDDIQALIDSQVRESQEIEFKEGLSTKEHSSDSWSERRRLSDGARGAILKQVTAFANAYGGVLILGIRESNTKLSVAKDVAPMPRCADLAERLKLVVRDGVEPRVPTVEVTAVPVEDENGVVVVRVGASRMAPHRVQSTRVCAVRTNDRTEEMTMREIQDMTLNVARGLEGVERRFNDRAERFEQEFARLYRPDKAWGVRVTAIPVGENLRIDQVYAGYSVDTRFLEAWRRVASSVAVPDAGWRTIWSRVAGGRFCAEPGQRTNRIKRACVSTAIVNSSAMDLWRQVACGAASLPTTTSSICVTACWLFSLPTRGRRLIESGWRLGPPRRSTGSRYESTSLAQLLCALSGVKIHC